MSKLAELQSLTHAIFMSYGSSDQITNHRSPRFNSSQIRLFQPPNFQCFNSQCEVATSSSKFYRIIRAGIGVSSLVGLTKSCSCPRLRTEPPVPFIQPPKQTMGKEKKPINMKNFGGTPPGVCPVSPGDILSL